MYTKLDEAGFINPHTELLLTSLQPEKSGKLIKLPSPDLCPTV